jgi:hypothetical protein
MSVVNLFAQEVTTENSGTMELVNSFEKNSNLLHSFPSGYIEDEIMLNHEPKKRRRRSENLRFYGQNKLRFWHPILHPSGTF